MTVLFILLGYFFIKPLQSVVKYKWEDKNMKKLLLILLAAFVLGAGFIYKSTPYQNQSICPGPLCGNGE